MLFKSIIKYYKTKWKNFIPWNQLQIINKKEKVRIVYENIQNQCMFNIPENKRKVNCTQNQHDEGSDRLIKGENLARKSIKMYSLSFKFIVH